MSNLSALAPDSLVLVTGANGYVGSQIVNTLLTLGFRVRGTIRSPKPWLDDLLVSKFGSGRFESIILEDLRDKNALASAMTNTSGVVHVASDLSFSDDANAVIPWVVESTQYILSTAGSCPSVQRVVLTSSCAAVITPTPGKSNAKVGEETYNDADVKAAWDPNTPKDDRAYAIYAASKIIDRASNESHTGHILHPNIAGSTMACVRGLLKGNTELFSLFRARRYVDVIDTARLHSMALLSPEITSRRLFAFGEPTSIGDVLQQLRALQPHNSAIPEGPEFDFRDETDVPPNDKAKLLLKNHFDQEDWTSLESSLREGIADLEPPQHTI